MDLQIVVFVANIIILILKIFCVVFSGTNAVIGLIIDSSADLVFSSLCYFSKVFSERSIVLKVAIIVMLLTQPIPLITSGVDLYERKFLGKTRSILVWGLVSYISTLLIKSSLWLFFKKSRRTDDVYRLLELDQLFDIVTNLIGFISFLVVYYSKNLLFVYGDAVATMLIVVYGVSLWSVAFSKLGNSSISVVRTRSGLTVRSFSTSSGVSDRVDAVVDNEENFSFRRQEQRAPQPLSSFESLGAA